LRWPFDVRLPGSSTATSPSATTIAAIQAPTVRHGCRPHARASRSVSPTPREYALSERLDEPPDLLSALRCRLPRDPDGGVDLRALPVVDLDQDAQRLRLRLARRSREEVGEQLHRLRLALVDPPDVEQRLSAEPCVPGLDDLPQHVEVGGDVV